MEPQSQQSHFTHLTDAQFSDLLLGTSSPSVRAHLDVCSQCAEEAGRVSGAIGSFEQQSRLWAERRAASMPLPASHRQPAFHWLHRPQAWTAAVFAVALAVGIGVSVRNNVTVRTDQPAAVPKQATATTQAAPAVLPATLKADNELLAAIDQELREDTSSPTTMYGLRVSSHGSRTRMSKRISNE